MKIKDIMLRYCLSHIAVYGKIKKSKLRDHFGLPRRQYENFLKEVDLLDIELDGHYLKSENVNIDILDALDTVFNHSYGTNSKTQDFVNKKFVKDTIQAIDKSEKIDINYYNSSNALASLSIVPSRITQVSGMWTIEYWDVYSFKNIPFCKIQNIKKTNIKSEKSNALSDVVLYIEPKVILSSELKDVFGIHNNKLILQRSEISDFKNKFEKDMKLLRIVSIIDKQW